MRFEEDAEHRVAAFDLRPADDVGLFVPEILRDELRGFLPEDQRTEVLR
jgi:hypothetical protein